MSGQIIGPIGVLSATGPALDAATTAWINAVVADGGSVSGTQQTRVNTLITALKGTSYSGGGTMFAAIDRLWLYGGESDVHQAKIDIANLSAHTVNGTPTLAAGGYTGNGTSDYINSHFDPTVGTNKFISNSCGFGCYTRTNRTSGSNMVSIGCRNFVNYDNMIVPLAGAGPFTAITECDTNVQTVVSGRTTAMGSWFTSRTGANTSNFFVNGSAIGPDVISGEVLVSAEMYILAENQIGTGPGSWSSDQQAAAWFTGGFSSTDVANFETALNAYMTSWGIAVH